MSIQQLLRDMAADTAISWGTTAPFSISELKVEKVGFGDIPLVYCLVTCPANAQSALVPIVRQLIFRELELTGIPNEILALTPRLQLQSTKRRRFVDCNSSSPTKGKNKMGYENRYGFEIKHHKFLDYFEWGGFCKKYGKIPERRMS